MTSIRHDLRYAVRSLRRHPGFALVAATTLALGIGATTAIFSVVNSVLLRPLPFPDADRIMYVWDRSTQEPREVGAGQMSWVGFLDYRDGTTAFEAMTVYRGSNVTLTEDDGAEIVPGAEISAGFFDVFGAAPVRGRAFTDEETRHQGPDVAIVGHGFWQERMGGRSDVIGSLLRLRGSTYQVVGVAPDGFDYPRGARIWLPVRNDDEGCGRGCYLFEGAALLREGVPEAQGRAEIETVAARIAQDFPESNTNTTGDIAPLRDVIVGDVRLALFVVFGAVVMVLLIACANVANLMLVRGTTRNTEMAVRAVLGAGRRRLVAQLVTESAVLALVGTVAGVMLAAWGVDALRDRAPISIPRIDEIALDATAFAFAAGMAALTIALFGLAPAFRLSSVPFAQALREGGRGSTGSGSRARAIILAVEVALSVTLLLGAGLLLRSLAEMRAVDPGFRTEDIAHFTISLPDVRYPDNGQAVQFVETVGERLRALPGVENAGFVIGMPFGRTRVYGGFERTDRPPPEPGEGVEASYRVVDPSYFATLDIPVLRGRNFQPTDRWAALPVAIVNERFVTEFYPGEDPLGKQIDISVSVGYPDTLPRTIVGVVGDTRSFTLTQADRPAMYVPEAQAGGGFGAFVIRTTGGNPADILVAARSTVAGVDPQIPLVRPGTMPELLAADTARHSFYLTLIGLFAVLAVALAAVGMYGVVAFTVAQRTREIGVRMALGARAPEVVSLVVWQGLRPAIAGAVTGVVGALAAGRIIQTLLYGVEPRDPLTVVGVCAILLGVVALACTIPARRATRIPPALALRNE